MTHVRPTSVAGQFYPADPGELRRQLNRLLAEAAPPADGRLPKALIAPHAGYIYSGAVAASAYSLLRAARGRVSRVVLIGPSHRVAFHGLAVGRAESWDSPLGPVAVDVETIRRLADLPMVGALDQAHAGEHSLEVHIPFLQTVLGAFTLVPIVAGDARADEVATVLDAAWGGPETVIVASTDLSHFHDYATCRSLDAATVAAIERLDPSGLGQGSACGRVPVAGLLNTARRRGMRITTLDVRNSGDTAGPKDRVVGYGAWALYEPDSPDEAAAIRSVGPDLVALARASIAHGLATGLPAPISFTADMPDILGAPGAAFVTLKLNGRLRGCIGSASAWRPLIEDVADNAFKAAFSDPRFPSLSSDEFKNLELSVSVLTPPVAMTFAGEDDLLAQLRPGIDGLIIDDSGRRALFLPSVWSQLGDRHLFLEHLKAKAGLAPSHWSPTFRASRFQAVEVT